MLVERDYANQASGIVGPAKIGTREMVAAVIRRGEPVIPQHQVVRQLHSRLAPARPNTYAAA